MFQIELPSSTAEEYIPLLSAGREGSIHFESPVSKITGLLQSIFDTESRVNTIMPAGRTNLNANAPANYLDRQQPRRLSRKPIQRHGG